MFNALSAAPRARLLTLLLAAVVLPTSLLLMSLHPLSRLPRARARGPRLLEDDALLRRVSASASLVHFPAADVLLAFSAKGGSTSIFRWLYRGLTGDGEFSKLACGTYVQDIESSCWRGQATYVRSLSASEQRRVLTSRSTLRVAVQRDPFDRLISAFKDKFACVSPEVNSKLPYTYIVPYLRQLASLPPQRETCMNISEFAGALDAVRRNRHAVPLQRLDVHIRPQQFHFEHIAYDIVLDVSELSNASLLTPVWTRLPFRESVPAGVGHFHAVKMSQLTIPEEAAKKLFRFASESRLGERRHLL